MEIAGNKWYIRTDGDGNVISGWSGAIFPERDTESAVVINEQGGYQFRLVPGGAENPPLRTEDEIPLYRWDGERVIARTAEEIAADRAALAVPEPRTDLDRMAGAYLEGVAEA